MHYFKLEKNEHFSECKNEITLDGIAIHNTLVKGNDLYILTSNGIYVKKNIKDLQEIGDLKENLLISCNAYSLEILNETYFIGTEGGLLMLKDKQIDTLSHNGIIKKIVRAKENHIYFLNQADIYSIDIKAKKVERLVTPYYTAHTVSDLYFYKEELIIKTTNSTLKYSFINNHYDIIQNNQNLYNNFTNLDSNNNYYEEILANNYGLKVIYERFTTTVACHQK
jgi:hypothetical protein